MNNLYSLYCGSKMKESHSIATQSLEKLRIKHKSKSHLLDYLNVCNLVVRAEVFFLLRQFIRSDLATVCQISSSMPRTCVSSTINALIFNINLLLLDAEGNKILQNYSLMFLFAVMVCAMKEHFYRLNYSVRKTNHPDSY